MSSGVGGGEEYEVTLRRRQRQDGPLGIARSPEPLGIDVGLMKGPYGVYQLVVQDVGENGMVAVWNRQNHELRRIAAGDAVVCVNGSGEPDSREMARKLKMDSDLTIKLRRPQKGSRPQTSPAGASPRAPGAQGSPMGTSSGRFEFQVNLQLQPGSMLGIDVSPVHGPKTAAFLVQRVSETGVVAFWNQCSHFQYNIRPQDLIVSVNGVSDLTGMTQELRERRRENRFEILRLGQGEMEPRPIPRPVHVPQRSQPAGPGGGGQSGTGGGGQQPFTSPAARMGPHMGTAPSRQEQPPGPPPPPPPVPAAVRSPPAVPGGMSGPTGGQTGPAGSPVGMPQRTRTATQASPEHASRLGGGAPLPVPGRLISKQPGAPPGGHLPPGPFAEHGGGPAAPESPPGPTTMTSERATAKGAAAGGATSAADRAASAAPGPQQQVPQPKFGAAGAAPAARAEARHAAGVGGPPQQRSISVQDVQRQRQALLQAEKEAHGMGIEDPLAPHVLLGAALQLSDECLTNLLRAALDSCPWLREPLGAALQLDT